MVKSLMKCPECLERIHDRADECPHCGMTLQRLLPLYQHISPLIQDGIHDVAGILNNDSRKQLRKAIQATIHQFVGINLAISFVSLKNEQTIKTYGFWLLNQGNFNNSGTIVTGDEEGQGRVILVIDVENKQASLAYGYLLDGCIREKETFQMLSSGHANLLEGNFLKGCILILKSLKSQLKIAVRRAKKGARARK